MTVTMSLELAPARSLPQSEETTSRLSLLCRREQISVGQKPSRSKIGRADLIMRPVFDLVLPDDALVSIHLALDPVLKYATGLGDLSNNLVATLSFAISTKTG